MKLDEQINELKVCDDWRKENPCPTTLSLVRYVIDEFRLRDDELNEAYRRKHLWHILYSV